MYYLFCMSIHVDQSEEAKIALEKQKKKSTAMSVLASVTIVGGLAGALSLITYFIPEKSNDPFIPPPVVDTEFPDADPTSKTLKKPSSSPQPASSLSAIASVITVSTSTPLNIKNTDIATNTESDTFGDMGDIGEVFVLDGDGVDFFVPVQGKRIAYVIDYSASMIGKRDEIMRDELTRSLETMPMGREYSLIFFAGPVWSAGDTVSTRSSKNSRKATEIQYENTDTKVDLTKGNAVAKMRNSFEPHWVSATSSNINKSIQQVKSSPLIWGTRWDLPLEFAINMSPKPDAIIFMTDGATDNAKKVAREYGEKAAAKGITINTVALLEPKAKEGMKILADKTGGTAISVLDGGNKIQDLFTGEITER